MIIFALKAALVCFLGYFLGVYIGYMIRKWTRKRSKTFTVRHIHNGKVVAEKTINVKDTDAR